MLNEFCEKVKKRLIKNRHNIKLFLAILPSIIICFLYSYRPLWGILYSFYEYKPRVSIWESEFVGLKYYNYILGNRVQRRELLRVLRNTLAMSGISMLTTWLPMYITVLLNEIKKMRFKKLIQTSITIPHFVSYVIIYSAFFNLFAPSEGLVANILRGAGIIEGNLELLISAKYGWFWMWFVGNWKGLGWATITYMAALSGIDQELYEAAAIDGAGRFHKMRYITIPLLMPTFITLFILNIGNILSSDFDKIFNFMNSFNKATIETIDLYVYNVGLVGFNISLGTAVGLAKSIVGIMLMLLVNYLSKKIRGNSIF